MRLQWVHILHWRTNVQITYLVSFFIFIYTPFIPQTINIRLLYLWLDSRLVKFMRRIILESSIVMILIWSKVHGRLVVEEIELRVFSIEGACYNLILPLAKIDHMLSNIVVIDIWRFSVIWISRLFSQFIKFFARSNQRRARRWRNLLQFMRLWGGIRRLDRDIAAFITLLALNVHGTH
jgi:hypothetical protein